MRRPWHEPLDPPHYSLPAYLHLLGPTLKNGTKKSQVRLFFQFKNVSLYLFQVISFLFPKNSFKIKCNNWRAGQRDSRRMIEQKWHVRTIGQHKKQTKRLQKRVTLLRRLTRLLFSRLNMVDIRNRVCGALCFPQSTNAGGEQSTKRHTGSR